MIMLRILAFVLQGLLFSPSIQATLVSQQERLSLNSSSLSSPSSKIPGGSPLRFCNESSSSDLFSVTRIEVLPDELYIDDVFTVKLYGNFSHPINENATWTSFVRYGNSSENETWTQPFCRMIESIDQPDPDHKREKECPPEAGWALLTMEGWVWEMFIVPGDYYFKFNAKNGDGRRIYCLETNIRLVYRDDDDKHNNDNGGGTEL